MRKLPFKALAAFAASPQGRRAIANVKAKLDTPGNRRKANELWQRARSSRRRSSTSGRTA